MSGSFNRWPAPSVRVEEQEIGLSVSVGDQNEAADAADATAWADEESRGWAGG